MASPQELSPAVSGYVGRFAPSPTGPLHFGSLVAAIASYVDARANGGRWLLRIEDVDRTRCSLQAEQEILRQLAAFGFVHDGPIVRQRDRDSLYEQALNALWQQAHLFACTCSRKMLEGSYRNRDGEIVYPGTCRHAGFPRELGALRLRIDPVAAEVPFNDVALGEIRQNLFRDVGDFVLRRADGLYAYQLAVVVDDGLQGVTHVVRGEDLLFNTPRQIYLQQLLSLPQPIYMHVPLVRTAAGEKLSKQTNARAIDEQDRIGTLHRAWTFLRQAPIQPTSSISDFWSQAVAQWDVSKLRREVDTATASFNSTDPVLNPAAGT